MQEVYSRNRILVAAKCILLTEMAKSIKIYILKNKKPNLIGHNISVKVWVFQLYSTNRTFQRLNITVTLIYSRT